LLQSSFLVIQNIVIFLHDIEFSNLHVAVVFIFFLSLSFLFLLQPLTHVFNFCHRLLVHRACTTNYALDMSRDIIKEKEIGNKREHRMICLVFYLVAHISSLHIQSICTASVLSP